MDCHQKAHTHPLSLSLKSFINKLAISSFHKKKSQCKILQKKKLHKNPVKTPPFGYPKTTPLLKQSTKHFQKTFFFFQTPLLGISQFSPTRHTTHTHTLYFVCTESHIHLASFSFFSSFFINLLNAFFLYFFVFFISFDVHKIPQMRVTVFFDEYHTMQRGRLRLTKYRHMSRNKKKV